MRDQDLDGRTIRVDIANDRPPRRDRDDAPRERRDYGGDRRDDRGGDRRDDRRGGDRDDRRGGDRDDRRGGSDRRGGGAISLTQTVKNAKSVNDLARHAEAAIKRP